MRPAIRFNALLIAGLAIAFVQPLAADFFTYPAVRPARSQSALDDVVAHCANPGTYRDSDPITTTHETTHGVNSDLRQRSSGSGRKVNGFYVLHNRAAVLPEPHISLRSVTPSIPTSLRGRGYQLYMVSQAVQWNDSPLYVFDEWTAYTNGTVTANERGGASHGEAGSMTEFIVYAWAVVEAASRAGDLSTDVLKYVKWNTRRAVRLAANDSEAQANLQRMRTAPDAENWRNGVRAIAGTDWANSVLGF